VNLLCFVGAGHFEMENYKIKSDGYPLGGGAYGIVYSASDRATNQAVAVKMIPLLQAEITKKLAGEIYLLYEIEHPNIVRCAFSST
jgi:serine/threonine protein kinase